MTILGVILAMVMFSSTRSVLIYVLTITLNTVISVLSSSVFWVIGYIVYTSSQRG